MNRIYKLSYWITAILCLLVASGSSFAGVSGHVTLTGLFTDSSSVEPGDELQVKVVRNYANYEWIGYAKSYKATIDENRHFVIGLPAEEQLFYIMLSVSKKRGFTVFLDLGQMGELPLLVAAGDSLNLAVREGGHIDFEGKGAEKLKCQQQLYELGFVPKSGLEALNALFDPSSFGDYYERLLDLTEKNLQMKKTVLRCYQNRLPENIYNILYYDCVGFQYGRLYRSFYNSQKAKYFNERRTALKALIKKKAGSEWVFPKLGKEAVFSAYYIGALFEKTRLELAFAAPGMEVDNHFPFKDYANMVGKTREGLVREALMLYGYVEFSGKESMEYAEAEFTLWPDNQLRGILEDWMSKNKVNTKAYSFELPDSNGKIHRLEEFAGKVIVADFWFTGCFGCKLMPAAMRTVIDRFKGMDNVVFISINVDANQERWREGLESDDYTLPEQVELSTYGWGKDRHPLLGYYNITSYPRLLIIDQKGNNVATSPPDPRTDNGKGIIQIVESLF